MATSLPWAAMIQKARQGQLSVGVLSAEQQLPADRDSVLTTTTLKEPSIPMNLSVSTSPERRSSHRRSRHQIRHQRLQYCDSPLKQRNFLSISLATARYERNMIPRHSRLAVQPLHGVPASVLRSRSVVAECLKRLNQTNYRPFWGRTSGS